MRRVFTLKRLFLIYSLPLILAISLLSVFDVFERAELFFLDRAFQLRDAEEPRKEIAIVAISQDDFERGAPRWPWPRSLMARLVDEVSSYRPAVIAIDILYSERTTTQSVITSEQFADIQPHPYRIISGVVMNIQTAEGPRVIGPGNRSFDLIASGATSARAQDQELADAVQRARDNGVGVVLAAQTISGKGVVGLAEPYPSLASAAGNSLGLVGIRVDADGVLRNYLPYGQDKEGKFVYGLALAAVAQFKGVDLPARPLSNGDVAIGEDLLVEISEGQFLVNFRGPPDTHPTFIAGRILEGEVDFSDKLRGKIVFIGVTDPSAEDLVSTPFSGVDRMAGVEFHAAAADTLLSDSFISSAPRYQEILMILVLGLAAIALGRFLKPWLSLPGTGWPVVSWVGRMARLWEPNICCP